jgi:hypothetical protein
MGCTKVKKKKEFLVLYLDEYFFSFLSACGAYTRRAFTSLGLFAFLRIKGS